MAEIMDNQTGAPEEITKRCNKSLSEMAFCKRNSSLF